MSALGAKFCEGISLGQNATDFIGWFDSKKKAYKS